MIICFTILCGCEYDSNSEYEDERYTISEDDDFGLSLGDYESNGEFKIGEFGYDLLKEYEEQYKECIDDKIDWAYIAPYAQEIKENNYSEEEIAEVLNDFKDMIFIEAEKECSVQK